MHRLGERVPIGRVRGPSDGSCAPGTAGRQSALPLNRYPRRVEFHEAPFGNRDCLPRGTRGTRPSETDHDTTSLPAGAIPRRGGRSDTRESRTIGRILRHQARDKHRTNDC